MAVTAELLCITLVVAFKMELELLEVRTGCRLHFGLMELAQGAPRRFAGLGLMLAAPSFVLSFFRSTDEIALASNDHRSAEIEQRIQSVVALREALLKIAPVPRSEQSQIRVRQALPMHSGLGAGTQLACAVAVGLELLDRDRSNKLAAHIPGDCPPGERGGTAWLPVNQLRPPLSPRWLVKHAGRGLRSAVGLSGFLQGGLLLDEGYLPEPSQELEDRPLAASSTPLPSAWRVVLIVPNCAQRVHGQRESELMEELGNTANPQSSHMLHLAERIRELAQVGHDFTTFTDLLDQYMELGARLFSRFQRGLYNGPEITQAVEMARAAGLRGVGQSSWGPTVFGFTEHETQATQVARHLTQLRPDWSVIATRPATVGAEVRWLS